MTRADWWLGVGLLVLAILLHGSLQRYQVLLPEQGEPKREMTDIVRVDRWTGNVEVVHSQSHFPPWLEIF